MTDDLLPKILPGVGDILRCVREVTHDLLAPTLVGHSERSAAATIDHLLRYAEALVAYQGQVLYDEEAMLATELPRAADWLADRPRMAALAAAIRRDCSHVADPGVYPTLAMMEDRVALLRQHVCDTLEALHEAGATRDAAGDAIHAALRDYIRWQVAKEGELVEPAFLGHGPRR